MQQDRSNKDKKNLDTTTEESSAVQRQENEEGLILTNDDGTPFDTDERTYVSVDLPEEEDKE
jgi:hypothetical protein